VQGVRSVAVVDGALMFNADLAMPMRPAIPERCNDHFRGKQHRRDAFRALF